MSKRRDEVLGLLGVERWLPNAAAAAVAAAPIAAAPIALAPIATALAQATAPAPPAVMQAAMATAATRIFIPASNWQALRAEVKDCMRCKLCKTRTNTVFGVGDPQASLMVVGEGPGADEDASGEPFVGRAGKLLDAMLQAIDRSRNTNVSSQLTSNSVFIANVVKCRPPGNRDPEKDEVDACRSYLDAQIAQVKPKLIVALGRIAAQRLLMNDEPLSKLRGPLHEYGATKTPVLVTYHPAYLLRSPKEKAKSWEDLKKIAQYLKRND